ncbi:MAG: heparinase II/III family protein [Negativicutes bacterium]
MHWKKRTIFMSKPNTVLTDQNHFKSELLTPFGFIMHSHYFLQKACAFLYYRLNNIGASPQKNPHKGMKQRPKWLMPLRREEIFPSKYFVNGVNKQSLPDCEDNEDYLRNHRWGWLNEDAAEEQDNVAILKKLQLWTVTNNNSVAGLWEPYSASERICNFVTWLRMQPNDFRKQVVDHSDWQVFMQQSATWIYEHLEYYGPTRTNNHILNNARALIMAGVYFPVPHYFDIGLEIFHNMLPQLIDQDGVVREQSSHYQLLILLWLLDTSWACKQIFSDANEKVRVIQDIIPSVARSTAILCDDQGRLLSFFGDISPDISPDKLEKRISKLYSATWPVLSGSEIAMEKGCSQSGNWLRIEVGNEIVLTNWPQGKFPTQYPTHGHSDATSVVWIHEGVEILCDLGRYRYTQDEISAFQKSGHGHNVALINGLSPICEPIVRHSVPEPYGSCYLDCPVFFDKGVVLRHNGYKRSNVVMKHERKIIVGNAQLTIQDTFIGEGEAFIELLWHFSGAITISANIASNNEIEALLEKHSCQSWLSQEYGNKISCSEISYSGRLKVPVIIETIIKIQS